MEGWSSTLYQSDCVKVYYYYIEYGILCFVKIENIRVKN
jgi:hypothetical protein